MPTDRGHVEVDGHRIAVHTAGEGAPVVLLHGIGTASFVWRRVLPLLSQRHQVFAVDLLGCGDSDMPLDVSYGVAAHARRIGPLLAGLGLQRAHLVGHDVGAGVIQRVAVERPELLVSMSMVNPIGYDYWPVMPISGAGRPLLRSVAMVALDAGALGLFVRRGLRFPERATPELLDAFRAPLRTREGRRAFLHFARSLDARDLAELGPRLRQVDVPALVVRGVHDRYLSAHICARLHADLRGSRLVELEDAGHFAQEDVPGPLCDELMSFFAEHDNHVGT